MSLANQPEHEGLQEPRGFPLDIPATEIPVGIADITRYRGQKAVTDRYFLLQRHGAYDEFEFETTRVTERNKWDLRHRAVRFEELLDYDSFRTHDEVRHNIRPRGEVVIVRTADRYPKDVAILAQEIREGMVGGRVVRCAAIGAKVVAEEFQGYGIGTQLTIDTIVRYAQMGRSIDFITGRTRKWEVIRTQQKTGLVRAISPIEAPMTPEAQQELQAVLHPAELKDLDLRTGVYANVYPSARPESFTPRKDNEAAMRIYNRLLELGVEPGGVNGIRYHTKIDQEALDAILARIDAGYGSLEVVKTPAGLISTIVRTTTRMINGLLKLPN